jgi:dTDP-4-amino-4,6-dideoxygalactose transaminase
MIESANANMVLVEISDDYTIDLLDLERKAKNPSAKWFLISHMRGQIADMDRVMSRCQEHGPVFIEDCALQWERYVMAVKVGRLALQVALARRRPSI